jgi:uncharacterized membrane protein
METNKRARNRNFAVLAIVLAVLLTCEMSVTFAANDGTSQEQRAQTGQTADKARPGFGGGPRGFGGGPHGFGGGPPFDLGEHPELTDEQKAEMPTKPAGERPKPKELTDEQKAEMRAKAIEQTEQLLADGKITQEQYDKQLASIENGEIRGFRITWKQSI